MYIYICIYTYNLCRILLAFAFKVFFAVAAVVCASERTQGGDYGMLMVSGV